tara:strand:+ start:9939 stop:10799 length:861 start_codon:yes stop_codon:yes gene_type:complete
MKQETKSTLEYFLRPTNENETTLCCPYDEPIMLNNKSLDEVIVYHALPVENKTKVIEEIADAMANTGHAERVFFEPMFKIEAIKEFLASHVHYENGVETSPKKGRRNLGIIGATLGTVPGLLTGLVSALVFPLVPSVIAGTVAGASLGYVAGFYSPDSIGKDELKKINEKLKLKYENINKIYTNWWGKYREIAKQIRYEQVPVKFVHLPEFEEDGISNYVKGEGPNTIPKRGNAPQFVYGWLLSSLWDEKSTSEMPYTLRKYYWDKAKVQNEKPYFQEKIDAALAS